MNPKVDAYIQRSEWSAELAGMRKIILDCQLQEELKWGAPCYTYQGSNILLIHTFKDYCAMLFMKGALLKDPKGILIQQTENVQSARQIRFTDVKQIKKLEATLKAYIYEAVEIEESGVKVPKKTTAEYPVPEEFQRRLDEKPALRTAFEKLTPGRQRGYLLYFSSAKQSKTREQRVEKYLQQILDGRGLED